MLRIHWHSIQPRPTSLQQFNKWGSAGFPLTGFDAAGDCIDSEWNVPLNEPIRKTIRAWVAFLKEPKTFRTFPPTAAGVAGAPDLAAFEGRVATALAKP